MHLDDEQLQRAVHGELSPAHTLVRDHLDSCDACRLRVEQEAREEQRVFDLLRAIDRPAPDVSIAAIARRAHSRRSRRGIRVAALVLGLGVAGVAYAAPGSPLTALLRRLVASHDRAPRTRAAESSAVASEPTTGIAVAPGPRLTIQIIAGEGGALATVSLSDGSEVVVRAVGGNPSFSSDIDRLVVRNADDVRAFEIEIPRDAPSVEIRTGRGRVLLKTGSSVVADGPRDADGRYALRLGGPGR